VTDGHEAVIATRAAYEQGAAAWAGRRSDRSSAQARLHGFAALVRETEPGGRVLDLGCGPGFDSRDLSANGLAVVGLDVTRAMLALSTDRPDRGRGLVQGDSRFLPFSAGTFAGIWASASMLHLPKSQVGQALAEVTRVLRSGGIFYSAMKEGAEDGFDGGSPGGAVTGSRYFAHYGREEWTGLVESAGFRVLEQEIDPDSRPGFPDWIVTVGRKR
jgi:SAM-dependent methyltransferase